MTLLMQRLRTLQLRLNSVDPGAVTEAGERVLEWRGAAGDARGAENRRQRVHTYVTGSMNDLTADLGQRLESEFLPRLTQSFRTLIPEVQSRADAVAGMRAMELEDEYTGRLRALERNTAASDAQLTELLDACADTYRKLSEVNERLDRIWADDGVDTVGGWRTAMSQVRAEKEASEKTPIESFREDAFGDDDDLDLASYTGLTCPICHELTGKRQARTGFMEDFAGVVGIAPYRCSRCMIRFYRYRPSRKHKRS
jgi:hypothetical protein